MRFLPYQSGMAGHNDNSISPAGRWVNDQEYARVIGVHWQTLRNWRLRDRKEGRTEGRYYGNVLYKKFGDVVRYWLPAELENPLAAEARDAR